MSLEAWVALAGMIVLFIMGIGIGRSWKTSPVDASNILTTLVFYRAGSLTPPEIPGMKWVAVSGSEPMDACILDIDL